MPWMQSTIGLRAHLLTSYPSCEIPTLTKLRLWLLATILKINLKDLSYYLIAKQGSKAIGTALHKLCFPQHPVITSRIILPIYFSMPSFKIFSLQSNTNKRPIIAIPKRKVRSCINDLESLSECLCNSGIKSLPAI